MVTRSPLLFRLDISFLIKYQPPQEVDTAEEQKRKFNKCEKKLLWALFALQLVFILFAGLNSLILKIQGKVQDSDSLAYLIEAIVYLMILLCTVFISILFI
jgi:hypothetical protein